MKKIATLILSLTIIGVFGIVGQQAVCNSNVDRLEQAGLPYPIPPNPPSDPGKPTGHLTDVLQTSLIG